MNRQPTTLMALTRLFLVSQFCLLSPAWSEDSPVLVPPTEISRLGGANRFTAALGSAADLEHFLTQSRADVEDILRQTGWHGDANALFEALKAGGMEEIEFPIGGRLQWMAARRKGVPQPLYNVEWRGRAPFPAFRFRVDTDDIRYTFVVPKACGNLALLEAVGLLTVTLTSGELQITQDGKQITVRAGESYTIEADLLTPGLVETPGVHQPDIPATVRVEEGTIEFRDPGHPVGVFVDSGAQVSATRDAQGDLQLSYPQSNPGPARMSIGNSTGTMAPGTGMSVGWGAPPVCQLSVSPSEICLTREFTVDATASNIPSGTITAVEATIAGPGGKIEELGPPAAAGTWRWSQSYR